MMVPLLLSIEAQKAYHNLPMKAFFRYCGISRQGFYKAKDRLNKTNSIYTEIEDLVTTYRRLSDRRAGARSLYYNLGIKDKFSIGVTKFERVVSEIGLSLRPLRTKVVTTQSSLQSWNYPNLINGISINDINQVVVGDLTYVYLGKLLYYLFCLIDVYSARIVGYQFNRSMKALDADKCRAMWFSLRGKEHLEGCIHHTDGGGQYFSSLYLGNLIPVGIRISCAENCIRNGYAEQRNGLIKHHFIPTMQSSNLRAAQKEMKKIIDFYNHTRKQEALGWLSPVEFENNITRMDVKPILNLYKFDNGNFGFL